MAVNTSHSHSYRPEIDGLRAIAVLAVLIYHIDPPLLHVSGGFTGVDVFFVISGYLITRLLSRAGNRLADLRNFYVRRFWRIFPALFAMLGVSLTVGYFTLMPDDYADLGESARSALFALSNLFFYHNTGYFDQSAELLPLLHTWSLAVEEQFYLFWPLLLMALAPLNPRLRLTGVALAVVASLCYAVWLLGDDGKAAFYHPLARTWELGLGGLVAIMPQLTLSRFQASALDSLGLALVLLSFFTLTNTDPFPGLNAAYACLGAALLVLPKQRSAVSYVLATAPMRGIGLISYSLYLWHWPILVLALHATPGQLNGPQAIAVVIASFAFAYLSWRYVEQPFRRPLPGAGKSRALVAAGTMLTLCAAATGIFLTEGVKNRLPDAALPLSDRDAMWQWQPENESHNRFKAFVTIGAAWQTADHRYVLWGDSHAEHFAPLVEAMVRAQPRTSVALYRSCPANIDGTATTLKQRDAGHNRDCATKRQLLIDYLQSAQQPIEAVILASSWVELVHNIEPHKPWREGLQRWSESLEHTTRELARLVPRIVIVGQIPSWATDPLPCALSHIAAFDVGGCNGGPPRLLYSQLSAAYLAVDQAIVEIAARSPHVQSHIVTDYLCDRTSCLAYYADEFLYMDTSHLRRNLPPATRADLARLMHLDRLFDNALDVASHSSD